MPNYYNEKEYVHYKEEKKGGFSLFKLFKKLVFKIILSPLVILIIAYIYFDDFRKAWLVAMIFYSALTVFSIITNFFQVFLAMATFNLFKFIKKSFKIIFMILALFIYWIIYIFMWGTNFNL
jgi:hypothetical protein